MYTVLLRTDCRYRVSGIGYSTKRRVWLWKVLITEVLKTEAVSWSETGLDGIGCVGALRGLVRGEKEKEKREKRLLP